MTSLGSPSRRRTHETVGVALALLALLGACRKRTESDVHLRLGDTMLAKAKPDKAITEYQRALKGQEHDDAVMRLAGVHETLGDFPKAETYLKQAEQKAPNDPTVRLSLGRVLAATGRQRDAFAQARRVLETAPDQLEALLLLAAFARTQDELEYAANKLQAWNTVHSLKPTDVLQPASETLVPLEALYRRLKDTEKADRAHGEAKRRGVKDLGLAITLANVYFSMDELEPAEELLVAATDANPKRAATWLRLAAVEVGRHKYALAGDALARLDAKLKAEPDTILIDARVRLGLGKPAEASDNLKALLAGPLKAGPADKSSRAHFWLAQAQLALDDSKSAEAELKRAIEADPTFTAGELALSELYLKQGRPDQAVTRLVAVTNRKPDAADSWQALGRAYMDARDPKSALAAFKHYSELHPDDAAGPMLEASALQALGQSDEAAKRLDTALALSPGAFGPLRELVVLLARKGSFVDAENRVHIELARKGRSAALLTLLGDVLFAERANAAAKLEEAEKIYREAVSVDPSYTAGWLALGSLYGQTDRAARAILMYGEALKHQADLTEAWLGVAQQYLKLGDARKAEAAYREIVERHPSFVPALNNLAYLYAEVLNQPDKALELARRAHAAAPGAANVTDTLGWILFKQQKAEAAVPLLQQSAKGLPQSAEAQFHLGMALLGTDQKDEGKARLAKALELSASFDGAKEARAALAAP
jgi:tetratricopeptide (TPR) repeat protein